MNVSSRTPEGGWHHCITCGKNARLDRSYPLGDTVCPSCGSPIFASPPAPHEADAMDKPQTLMRLISVDPANTYTFSQPKILIGRRISCHLHLSASNISSHHCLIEWASGEWWVRDLQSTNGTRINGSRIISALLQNGDWLTVAKTRMLVEIVAAQT